MKHRFYIDSCRFFCTLLTLFLFLLNERRTTRWKKKHKRFAYEGERTPSTIVLVNFSSILSHSVSFCLICSLSITKNIVVVVFFENSDFRIFTTYSVFLLHLSFPFKHQPTSIQLHSVSLEQSGESFSVLYMNWFFFCF